MPKSVCVICPVRNRQLNLESQIKQLITALGRITECFEIVVVDDGSTDSSADIGQKLAEDCCQVKFIRHASSNGTTTVVDTGLLVSVGILVFQLDERFTAGQLPDVSMITPPETDDALIGILTGLGLSFTGYRVHRRQADKRLVHDKLHAACPKNHFQRLLTRVSKRIE